MEECNSTAVEAYDLASATLKTRQATRSATFRKTRLVRYTYITHSENSAQMQVKFAIELRTKHVSITQHTALQISVVTSTVTQPPCVCELHPQSSLDAKS